MLGIKYLQLALSWEFVERVLVHPNTSDALKDHTELATWMGKPYPLNLRPLTRE